MRILEPDEKPKVRDLGPVSDETPEAPPPAVSATESALRGAAQGATLGWSDELAGLAGGAGVARQEPSLVLPKSVLLDPAAAAQHFESRPDVAAVQMSEEDQKKRLAAYLLSRDAERAKNAAASRAHPVAFQLGAVAGSAVPAALGGAGVATAAGQGALAGAGWSDADSAGGVASDSGRGLLLGSAAFGLGKALGAAGSKLGQLGAEKRASAAARAAAKAADTVGRPIASARGELGSAVQGGSRSVENVMRLEGAATPAQTSAVAGLRNSGVIPNLQQSVLQSTLEKLPGQAASIAEKKAALDALTAAAPAQIDELTQYLLSRKAVWGGVKNLAKRYGEPYIGQAIGGTIGAILPDDPTWKAAGAGIGAMIGGAAMGRVRQGQAIRNFLAIPGTQRYLGGTMQAASYVPSLAGEALAHGAPAFAGLAAAVTPSKAEADTGPKSPVTLERLQPGAPDKATAAAAHFDQAQKDPHYRRLMRAVGSGGKPERE